MKLSEEIQAGEWKGLTNTLAHAVEKLESQLAECQCERNFERKEKENAFRILEGVTDTCKKLECELDVMRKALKEIYLHIYWSN